MENVLLRINCVLLSCAAFLPFPADADAPGCAEQASRRTAMTIAAPHAVLRRAVLANVMLDVDLAPATTMAIADLKRRLVPLVDAQVACFRADAWLDEAVLDGALASALTAASAVPAITPYAAEKEPPSLRVESRIERDGEFLSVVAQIGIPCGSDAMWLLYAPHDGGWRRVLQWSSAPYTRIDGAWEGFQHAVSPRDAEGRWFAAVSHIRPWCTSSWSSVDYTVLRPGADADRPLVVLSGSDSLWWGGDDVGRLKVDARHAELRFRGASLDSGVHNREFIRRYDVSGTTPQRVAPVADSPRDFVDEWIVSAWAAARLRSHEASATALERAHEQLQAARKSASFEFGDTTACADGDALQVELRDGDEQSWFFRVAGSSDYRMVAVAAKPNAQCFTVLPTPDQ